MVTSGKLNIKFTIFFYTYIFFKYVDDNLSVMSIGFLLSSSDDAIIWRGPKKNGMIRQFLAEVDWGKLDFLLIDTPPGTKRYSACFKLRMFVIVLYF